VCDVCKSRPSPSSSYSSSSPLLLWLFFSNGLKREGIRVEKKAGCEREERKIKEK
jgi:hypothetical protein